MYSGLKCAPFELVFEAIESRMWGDLGPRDGESTLELYQAQHEEKISLKKKKAARKIQVGSPFMAET